MVLQAFNNASPLQQHSGVAEEILLPLTTPLTRWLLGWLTKRIGPTSPHLASIYPQGDQLLWCLWVAGQTLNRVPLASDSSQWRMMVMRSESYDQLEVI